MANKEHLVKLKECIANNDIEGWSKWRENIKGLPESEIIKWVELVKVDLSGANLIGANLREADLREADLGGSDLRGSDLRGANLIEANLIDANLRGADLRGANLRGANLREADLRGGNLGDANLKGASLRDANLTGTNWRDALYDNGIYHAVDIARPSVSKAEFQVEQREIEVESLKRENADLKIRLDEATGQERKELQKQIDERDKLLIDTEKKLQEAESQIGQHKKRQEKINDDIEKAIGQLRRPNAYIGILTTVHCTLACIFGGMVIITGVGIFYTVFYKPMIGECQSGSFINVYEFILTIMPKILLVSFFSAFLTLVNRRIRSIQMLQEKKRGIDTLQGIFYAINQLSDSPNTARERIDGVMDKLAEGALSLSNMAGEKQSNVEIQSDVVNMLKEARHLTGKF